MHPSAVAVPAWEGDVPWVGASAPAKHNTEALGALRLDPASLEGVLGTCDCMQPWSLAAHLMHRRSKSGQMLMWSGDACRCKLRMMAVSCMCMK